MSSPENEPPSPADKMRDAFNKMVDAYERLQKTRQDASNGGGEFKTNAEGLEQANQEFDEARQLWRDSVDKQD